ncbi:TPA: cell division protein SepF [Candidatus Woesearchaeota archaeon]|nr:cell division protein SepF [Candidatus Woesearchaeota archaeon]HIH92413.1 cell division protein SepF [Candidatus Woesearchaeota archaeon]HIJ18667.1 cell division protein SepF [Candidatus Woesearchaeota archaeon]
MSMKGFFSKLKEKMGSGSDILDQEGGPEYVELSSESSMEKAKILVRPYTLENFEDVKPVLDALREGHTLALVNIRPLKDKDLVELKRAINKIKKTCDAVEGDVAGFGENWIAAVPSFARIYRGQQKAAPQQEEQAEETEE